MNTRLVHPVFADLITMGEGIGVPQLIHYQVRSRVQGHNNGDPLKQGINTRV